MTSAPVNTTSALLLGGAALLCACPAAPVKPTSRPAVPIEEAKKEPHGDKGDPWQGRKDLIQAPPLKPVAALKLPSIKRAKLSNGLSLLVLRDASLPLVTVKLQLRVGSIDDPADKVGLADFTAEMLEHGAARLSADEIARRVDAVGARLGASPGYEASAVVCSGRKSTLALCLQMVADLAIRPTFPQKEMGEVRDGLLGQVRQARDDPDQLMMLHFYNQLYGDDRPAGRPMTARSVRAIKRADLVAFHRAHYRPQVAVLAVSGDVDPAVIEGLVKRRFRRWRRAAVKPRQQLPLADPRPGLEVLLVDKPSLTQSSFAVGHAGVNLRHPQRDALRVVNYVLGGGGFSSRLMLRVRSKGGKTYGISSAFYAHEKDGLFRVRSFTRNKQIAETLALVRDELRKIRKKPPTAAEIKAAKGHIAGGYALRFSTGSRLAAALALAQLRGLGDAYVTDFPLRVMRLTAQQVARAARQQIRPGRLVAVIVGKAAVVAPLLARAKIGFKKISYLAPISARERERAAAAVKITPQQARRGKALLARAIRAAGGLARLRRIKRARFVGVLKRGPIRSRFEALIAPPDRARLSFTLALKGPKKLPPMTMVQLLVGKRAWMKSGGRTRALPPDQVAALRAATWRQSMFVLQHARQRGVRLRPAQPAVGAGKVGLDVFPPAGRPLTLAFDGKTMRLVQLRYRGRDGVARVVELDRHRRVKGVWLPHRSITRGARTQILELSKIEINPRIDPKVFKP